MQPRTFALGLLTVAILGCAAKYEVPVAELPVALSPAAGATQVQARGQEGAFVVQYEVATPYPAGTLIKEIRGKISSEWVPRKEHILNPGIATSESRGWTNFQDMTTNPDSWVHQWQGEWQNPAGDLLTYTFQYRSEGPFGEARALPTPASPRLRVVGMLVPSAAVEQLKLQAMGQS